jgi:methylated-DNA-[protein]-cysteine S-methyltransferase
VKEAARRGPASALAVAGRRRAQAAKDAAAPLERSTVALAGFGAVTLVADSRALVAVVFSGHGDLPPLRWAGAVPAQPGQGVLAQATAALAAWAAGEPLAARLLAALPCDLAGQSPFTQKVLTATRAIPRGAPWSYGRLAAAIGQPGAARAVGGALGRNPLPIVIPCHRVLAHGGAIGGFTGGLAIKRALLRLEGTAVAGE